MAKKIKKQTRNKQTTETTNFAKETQQSTNQSENTKHSKEKGNLWRKFKENSLYFITVFTFLFGSGLIWKFCELPTEPEESKQEEIVVDSTDTSSVVETKKIEEQDTEKEKSNNSTTEDNGVVEPSMKPVYEDRIGEDVSSEFSEITGNEEDAQKEAYDKAVINILRKIPSDLEDTEQKIRNYANVTYKTDTIIESGGIWYKVRAKLHINDSILYNRK